MAETYTIKFKDIPSRKLRKSIRSFLKDDDVLIIGEDGQSHEVILNKNQLVFS